MLGPYLGPALDVGSALTAKILKCNGQVIYWSTFCHLMPDELADPMHVASWEAFDAKVLQVLGPMANWRNFPAKDHIPDPDTDQTDDDSLLGDGFDPIGRTHNLSLLQRRGTTTLPWSCFSRKVMAWQGDALSAGNGTATTILLAVHIATQSST